ncbi:MAG: alpha-hydroxy-acid oxidizing protein [Phascolarctobacterium sp.]|nr:alpha-hydroxy-acid oxidizing protein [Phascolarctobacterium sp.]
MNFAEVLAAARGNIGPVCKACPVCNGKACGTSIPGPGSRGNIAARNYEAWQKVYLNMDTLVEAAPLDLSLEIFGKKFKLPVFAGPVGAMTMHYGDKYSDVEYNNILVPACAEAGIAAFTGDGLNATVMEAATAAIGAANGIGVPTIKPWNVDTIKAKMQQAIDAKPFAMAMDIDGAGLPFLKNMNPPAGPKSVEEMKEIVKAAGVPFIVKGVMTVKGALKALEAGAAGIVVSNHGGRVLNDTPASADVLPAIVEAVGGKMKIFVDGGIRTGTDVFKALALGADAVIIARPFVVSIYGAGAEGVNAYVDKLYGELEDAMTMCGARSLKDITRDMVTIAK